MGATDELERTLRIFEEGSSSPDLIGTRPLSIEPPELTTGKAGASAAALILAIPKTIASDETSHHDLAPLAIVPDRSTAQPVTPAGSAAIFSFAAGLGLHILLAGLLMLGWLSTKPLGGGGQDENSIAVEIVAASALRAAAVAAPTQTQNEHTVAGEKDDGGSDQRTQQAAAKTPAEIKKPNKKNLPQPKPEVKEETKPNNVKPKPIEPVKPDAIISRPAKVKPPPKAVPPQPRPQPRPKRAGQRSTSSTTTKGKPQKKRSASPGQIRRFNASIWKSIQRKLPRKRAHKGTVTIQFSISPNGRARALRVLKSSGRRSLDRAVLRAIRRVKFKRPPRDMSPAQLTYKLPIRFR